MNQATVTQKPCVIAVMSPIYTKGEEDRSSPNFFVGTSEENKKVLENFLARLRWAKKRDSQIFRLQWAFFVVEALKTVKNR